MQTPRPLLDLVRFAPARPAITAGLRAGVAATLPLFAAPWIPVSVISWVSLGGYQGAIADKGGAYRNRAAAMATIVSLSSLACFLGSLVGNAPWPALPLTFVLLVLCGLAQAAGPVGASAGVTFAVSYVVSSAQPVPDVGTAALHAGGVIAGGALTMLLTLLLWPVRLYRPARLSIAACYEGLAEHAAMLLRAGESDESAREMHAHRAALRSTIEEARKVLTGTRRGRQAESERGERLVVLLENVDQLLGISIALEGLLETASPRDRERIVAALSAVGPAALAIAARLRSERELEGAVPRLPASEGNGAVGTLLGRLRRHMEAAAEGAEGLVAGRPLQQRAESLAPPAPQQRVRDRLRATLDVNSVILRHAIRLAVAATAASAFAAATRIEHGYWVTLTTIVILQPMTTATFTKGLQRMAGTTIGAGIAVVAVALIHQKALFVAIVFLMSCASVALLPINYGLFSVLLTPTFVLIAELGTGNYGLAWVRMIDTLVGGGIALVAARGLWPSWERHRFPEELSLALHLSAGWMREMGQSGASTTAAEILRRQTGIAILNAEASLQRLLSEVWTRSEDLEPMLAITLYMRRMHATALVFFSEAEPDLRGAAGEALARFLDEMARCIAISRPPGPSDELGGLEAFADRYATQGGVVGAALGRLARQAAILHGAATRAFAGGLLQGNGRG